MCHADLLVHVLTRCALARISTYNYITGYMIVQMLHRMEAVQPNLACWHDMGTMHGCGTLTIFTVKVPLGVSALHGNSQQSTSPRIQVFSQAKHVMKPGTTTTPMQSNTKHSWRATGRLAIITPMMLLRDQRKMSGSSQPGRQGHQQGTKANRKGQAAKHPPHRRSTASSHCKSGRPSPCCWWCDEMPWESALREE